MILHTLQQFKVLLRILCIGGCVLVLCLLFLESTPILSSGIPQLTGIAASQKALVERLAKDALLIEDGTSDQHIQAINELQITLPRWQSNQNQLHASILPNDVNILFEATASDYTAINTALQTILENTDHPASTIDIEVAIVETHEQEYYVNMSQILSLLQNLWTSSINWLFGLECFLEALLLLGALFFLLTIERSSRVKLREKTREGADSL